MYGFYLEKVYAFSFSKNFHGHLRIDKNSVYSEKTGYGWEKEASDTFLAHLRPGHYSMMQLTTDDELKEKEFDLTSSRLQLTLSADRTSSIVIKRPSQYMTLGPINADKADILLPGDVNLEKGNCGLLWKMIVLDALPNSSMHLENAEKGDVFYIVSDIFSEKKKTVLVMTMHEALLAIRGWCNSKEISNMSDYDVETGLKKGWNRLFLKIKSDKKQDIRLIIRVTDRMNIRDTAYGFSRIQADI